MKTERVKKPKLSRSQPIRSWSGLFDPPRAAPAATRRGAAAAAAAAPRSEAPPTRPEATVSDAVELGYSVIQEYIDEARQHARRVAGTPREARPSPDPERLTQRLFQYTSDLTNLWLEILQASSAPRPPPQGSAGPFGAGQRPRSAAPAPPSDGDAPRRATSAPSAGPSLRVEVSASRPAEVWVDLAPTPIAGPLVAHDLRAVDPDAPRIGGVDVEYEPLQHRVRVRLRVPDSLPAGTYSGLFLDRADNLPRGTLTVRVPERAAP